MSDQASSERQVSAELEDLCREISDRAWSLDSGFLSLASACHSPIERRFLWGLLAELFSRGIFARVVARNAAGERVEWLFSSCVLRRADQAGIPYEAEIEMQPEVVGLHPDFAIRLRRDEFQVEFLVECDGHEWHERTKGQATRDKRRDRSLAAAGHSVLRFTGSEIFSNPRASAKEALNAAVGILHKRVHGVEWGKDCEHCRREGEVSA